MNFSALDPKEVLIDSDALSEYQNGIDFFHLELARLNANIYVVEKIFDFPFEVFTDRMPILFRLVIDNFLDVAVLVVTRLASDSRADLYTLMQFKNRVLELVKPEYRQPFQENLRETRFDRGTQVLRKRAKALRDGRIAHIKREFNDEEALRSLSELKALRDKLNFVLDALSFNVERIMLPLEYSSHIQYHDKPDIEKLLDCIARDSYLLNMPEREPDLWRYRRERLPEGWLDKINTYRKKFGLPEG